MKLHDSRTGRIYWYTALGMSLLTDAILLPFIHFVIRPIDATGGGTSPSSLKLLIPCAIASLFLYSMWWLSDWSNARYFAKPKPLAVGLRESEAQALALHLTVSFTGEADQIKYGRSDKAGEWMVYAYGYDYTIRRMDWFARGWLSSTIGREIKNKEASNAP